MRLKFFCIFCTFKKNIVLVIKLYKSLVINSLGMGNRSPIQVFIRAIQGKVIGFVFGFFGWHKFPLLGMECSLVLSGGGLWSLRTVNKFEINKS